MFGSNVYSMGTANRTFKKASAKFILSCAVKCICSACFLFRLILHTLVKFLLFISATVLWGFSEKSHFVSQVQDVF